MERREQHRTLRFRLRWQVMIACFGLLVAVVFLAYNNQSVQTLVVPDSGGTYAEGVVGTPQYINPLLAQSDVDVDLSSLVFSGLTRTNDNGEIVADLAEQWSVSQDGRVWTFVLRQGVKWQDGFPFTADDVVFTIKTMQDPNFQGNRDLAALWKNVTVDKIGDLSVRLTLKEPYTPFLNYTTLGILPSHRLAGVPAQALPQEGFNQAPIGTGRFRLNPGDIDAKHVVLTANPDYYFERPYLDKLEFRFYPDYEAVLSGFKQREVQGIGYVPPDELAEVQQNPDLRLHSAQLSNSTILFFNTRLPKFADKQVRQALSYGLNRQLLVQKAVSGQGLASDSPIPPTSWAYKAEGGNSFDPTKARNLLDQALGSTNDPDALSGSVRLQFTLVTNDDPSRVKLANEIANQLKTIGVVVQVKSVSSADLVQKYLAPRQFEAALFGWQGLPNDPDCYQLWHSTQVDTGLNFSGFVNQEADQVLESARQSMSIDERTALYARFQDIFAEQTPSLVLYYPFYNYAVDKSIQGVSLVKVNEADDRFANIAEWFIKTKKVVVKGS
jgi:peptide/nickel transport system substrate-binding protein